MKRIPCLFILAAGLIVVPALSGQDAEKPKAEDPSHQQLRELRDRLVTAFENQDLDALLKDVHENAVVTWQNGEVSRGHKGIRDYYKKMLTGPEKVVEKVTVTKAEADDLTMLSQDGNHGLAWGTLDEHFVLADGTEFDLPNRFTAGLVKDGDKWKVVGLHVSANIFDNPVQALAIKKTMLLAGLAALAAGLIVGGLIVAMLMRRRSA